MSLGLPLGLRSIVALALILGLVFSHVAAYRYGGKQARAEWQAERLAQTQAALEATAENQRLATRHRNTVIEAQHAQTLRAQALASDADRARSERDRLRDDLAARSRDLPTAATAACVDHASTVAELLNQCGAALADVARQADGHANDAKTLSDAWPKPK